jgi:hypothetical protein
MLLLAAMLPLDAVVQDAAVSAGSPADASTEDWLKTAQ